MQIVVAYRAEPLARGYEVGAAMARAFRRRGHEVYEYGTIRGTTERIDSRPPPTRSDLLLFLECGDGDRQYAELRHMAAPRRAYWCFDIAIAPDRAVEFIQYLRFTHVFCGNIAFVNHVAVAAPWAGWLPFGVDIDHFAPAPAASSTTVRFVGTLTDERLRFFTALRDRGIDIDVWSGVYGDDYVAALHSAGVVLTYGVGGGDGLLPGRVWETLGCGVPLVAERRNGIERLLSDGKEVVLYDDVGECERRLRDLLSHAALRERIGGAGRIAIERGHTTDRRAGQILDAVLLGARPHWSSAPQPNPGDRIGVWRQIADVRFRRIGKAALRGR